MFQIHAVNSTFKVVIINCATLSVAIESAKSAVASGKLRRAVILDNGKTIIVIGKISLREAVQ